MRAVRLPTHQQQSTLPRMSAFGYLLGLYGENYERLGRLLGDARALDGDYVAHNGSEPTLYLTVLEQHRHTSILRLTHQFKDGSDTILEPSAWIRVYHDTEQAEVTHCLASSRLKQMFSMSVPVALVGRRRQRMNIFFNKWLEHLLSMGFGKNLWARAELAQSHKTMESRNV